MAVSSLSNLGLYAANQVFKNLPSEVQESKIFNSAANLFYTLDYHDFFENYRFNNTDDYAKSQSDVAQAINSASGGGP